MQKMVLFIFIFSLTAFQAWAKVDLAVLPDQAKTKLTIYNSADLTLVAQDRGLVLGESGNQLQFSWAGTLIDPTSLDLSSLRPDLDIEVDSLIFPPRTNNLGVWHITSNSSQNVPFRISYLTSGLSWQAKYVATLSKDETKMNLNAYIKVLNNSGEDYENAQVRLLVGKVNLIDTIAGLARRQPPYGIPEQEDTVPSMMNLDEIAVQEQAPMRMLKKSFANLVRTKPKKIVKQGLSEYFLYSIEGQENIPSGWSKRLISFEAVELPVMNLYKYDEQRYGKSPVRFLYFSNDVKHKLGKTPIPQGKLSVYRDLSQNYRLNYVGQTDLQYIPVGQKIEANLGTTSEVVVKPRMMNFRTNHYLFDKNGNISGWDEVREFDFTVRNTRDIPVKVEIIRRLQFSDWGLRTTGDCGRYEKVDSKQVKFSLELQPQEARKFGYVLTTHHGQRED